MNKFEYSFDNYDDNDCTSRGSCALPPGLVSLQELVLYFIKQAAYYIVKLENFNLSNIQIKNEIINHIASLIYLNEYSEKQMYELVLQCYYIFDNAKNRYLRECENKNLEPDKLCEILNFTDTLSLSKTILAGDYLIKELCKNVSVLKRNISNILFIVLKNVCQNISRLFDFGLNEENIISDILKYISNLENPKTDEEKLSQIINILTEINTKIQLKICALLFEKFGNISKVKVSHSTIPGKCILVSGNNFCDLLRILENTKNSGIDIYTHSNLLISHSFDKFRQYQNFKGHYGKGNENSIVDYGTFPGAILLTKNSKNDTGYLYRGKIFSNDYITPLGVTQIENNDYKELIQTAKNSVGFKKGRIMPDSDLGFNEEELNKLINYLSQRLDSGKIKRLFILGINAFSDIQNEYLDIFIKNLKQEEYVLSFYYKSDNKNVSTINLGNYPPLGTYIINKLLKEISDYDKVYFFFPICDFATVSSIIRLKNLGLKNIFISSCPAKTVNPSVFDSFKNIYNINTFTNPIDDLKNIRGTMNK